MNDNYFEQFVIQIWNNVYTIYVHCRKIWNLLVRPLETGRQACLWWAFLDCFAAGANELYISYVRILCLSCKWRKTITQLSENSLNKRIYIRFITISYCRSTCIRYQQSFIRPVTKQYFISPPSLVLKITHCRITHFNLSFHQTPPPPFNNEVVDVIVLVLFSLCI
jgi:hypothetical protein